MEGKIVFANPATLNLLGASHPSEIIGRNVLDFILPEFRDTVMKNMENDLDREITLPIGLHMLRIDGTSVIVEGRGVRTFTDGKPAIQMALRDGQYVVQSFCDRNIRSWTSDNAGAR
jgi:PAS domain S-box-containing protein